MKKSQSRRAFLCKTAIVSSGALLLSSTSVARAFSEVSCPYEGYNPFAEEKTDLRVTLLGKHVTVSGKIYDREGKKPLSSASIEVWHLSPGSTKYRHRAKIRTNEFGEYSFITDYPNKEPGKSHKIYFKVSAGATPYFTELSMNEVGVYITSKHWEENNQLENKLFPKRESFLGHSKITFNISLNTK